MVLRKSLHDRRQKMDTYIKPSTPYDSNIEWSKAFNLMDIARRKKKPIRIYHHVLNMIGNYKAIEYKKPPVTLSSWIEHGHLIYYKINSFEWKNISFDDIEKIEILD